jgi:hypothetical protein
MARWVDYDETYTPGDRAVEMGDATLSEDVALVELRRSDRAKLQKVNGDVLRTICRAHTRRSINGARAVADARGADARGTGHPHGGCTGHPHGGHVDLT